jgi:hypothetical protein
MDSDVGDDLFNTVHSTLTTLLEKNNALEEGYNALKTEVKTMISTQPQQQPQPQQSTLISSLVGLAGAGISSVFDFESKHIDKSKKQYTEKDDHLLDADYVNSRQSFIDQENQRRMQLAAKDTSEEDRNWEEIERTARALLQVKSEQKSTKNRLEFAKLEIEALQLEANYHLLKRKLQLINAQEYNKQHRRVQSLQHEAKNELSDATNAQAYKSYLESIKVQPDNTIVASCIVKYDEKYTLNPLLEKELQEYL